jgi:predicted nucleic acid-binding protein
MGDIGKDEFQLLRRRLLMDVAVRVFLVVRVEDRHYQEAERLIEKHGRNQKLRTLDALQLSVALDLRHRGMLDYFVCADKDLCEVAKSEGLAVINPEHP